ncbi:MAG: bifunctional hydroxymethylpyrimidine kinase/phosphomethylpyrimidine kinase [Planctomycetes bacterium]|nr:bifunctional hydroxymethylpyrimidine kinase/phosphomethylpyrimidine kinase [Planctomycetota bacterium]
MREGTLRGNILTIGLAPAWDVTCLGRGLDWGRHVTLESQSIRPAGKALNVSRALAWLGQSSIATGLWGREDIGQLRRVLRQTTPQIEPYLTPVPGATRVNVTIVDSERSQEMHLRCPSALASSRSLGTLTTRLTKRLKHQDLCVLSGALPGADLTEALLGLCRACVHRRGTRLVVDSYGPLFKTIVEEKLAWLIAPNVQELEELLGRPIRNTPRTLANAAEELLTYSTMVLVSRGKQGALLVTRRGAWRGRCRHRKKALSTVGCGDYLLAGFVAGLRQTSRPSAALTVALKTATARAWGWSDQRTWSAARRDIQVEVARI